LDKSPVLRSIRLRNYKGFRDHTISLKIGVNILVGANNAGKSTVLGALRLIAAMLPTARRINPTRPGIYNGQTFRGWPVSAAALEGSAFALENIRYDFPPDETSIEVVTSQRAKLVVTWEENYDSESPTQPMYYVVPPSGTFMSSRNAA
jgi:predicted ATPase